MPRFAKLHDGENLEFPDETADDVMDMTVRRHLAQKYPARQTMAEMPGEVAEYNPVYDAVQVADELVQTMHGLSAGQKAIADGLAQVAEAVRSIPPASNSVSIDVSPLTAAVEKLGEKIVEAARVPKKLTMDGDMPVGVEAA